MNHRVNKCFPNRFMDGGVVLSLKQIRPHGGRCTIRTKGRKLKRNFQVCEQSWIDRFKKLKQIRHLCSVRPDAISPADLRVHGESFPVIDMILGNS